jgi:hypothetical protein
MAMQWRFAVAHKDKAKPKLKALTGALPEFYRRKLRKDSRAGVGNGGDRGFEI